MNTQLYPAGNKPARAHRKIAAENAYDSTRFERPIPSLRDKMLRRAVMLFAIPCDFISRPFRNSK